AVFAAGLAVAFAAGLATDWDIVLATDFAAVLGASFVAVFTVSAESAGLALLSADLVGFFTASLVLD
ncbi:MAG: hypothetical protein Q4F40_00990, partial [Akkermansia sp.]|nr:hypothetical protein [Akkermansia sp.]